VNGTFYWDILRLFHEIKQGIVKAKKAGFEIESLAIDTWGVDFGLLDKKGDLLANPVHYRDKRNECFEELFDIIPKEELYGSTGIQFMNFNTVYQLLAEMKANPKLLDAADRLLMIPDLLNYFLTGVKLNEYTNATTGALVDAKSGKWAYDVLEKFGIPSHIFGDIVLPGTKVGKLSAQVKSEVGSIDADVFTVASHDTASAIMAVPSTEKDFVYISSGTWSLMGTELSSPVISDKSLEYTFTNEGGAEGKICNCRLSGVDNSFIKYIINIVYLNRRHLRSCVCVA
jgi:rhamnulokinase/L-fuculokinase